MASSNAVYACLFSFLLAALHPATCLAQVQQPNVTLQQLYQSVLASGYVYNPPDALGASVNVSALVNAGGSSTRRTVNEWPALAGNGLSQTAFTLGPCGLRQPHVHPRASGLLYTVQATNLQVGFIQLNGSPVINNLTTGASTVFPQGLLHFQQNLDCQPAKYIITYNDPEGQTVNAVPAMFNLPQTAVERVLGLNAAQYTQLKGNSVNGNFVPGSDPACMARCGYTLSA